MASESPSHLKVEGVRGDLGTRDHSWLRPLVRQAGRPAPCIASVELLEGREHR